MKRPYETTETRNPTIKCMKQLIKSQKIRIDDHSRGMAVGHFDDDASDIHLDKEAISGKYRIRVPLNTNRSVCVDIKGERAKRDEVPENIAREVREAFADEDKRRAFVKDLVAELKNYPYLDANKQRHKNADINRAFGALRRLSRHFGLEWSNRTVRGYLKEYKILGLRYMVTITDGPDLFYLSVDKYQFMISDYMMIGLRDRRTWEEIPFEEIENV